MHRMPARRSVWRYRRLPPSSLRSDLTVSPEEGGAGRRPVRANQLDGLSVFVVDDHQHTREMIATVLENAGADVRAAASAEDALMVLQTWQPQVMISDIEMQGQDGYELMQTRAIAVGESPAARRRRADGARAARGSAARPRGRVPVAPDEADRSRASWWV